MTPSDPDREDRESDAPVPPDPDPRPLDVDSAFAAIVAHWGEDDDSTGNSAHPWPAQEDLDAAPPVPDEPAPAAPPSTPADPTSPGSSGRGQLPAETHGDTGEARVIRPAVPDPFAVPPTRAEAELEESFVPPEPPPLPRGDLMSRLAWAGVLGGPLFLLLAAMVWREAPQLLVLGAVAAFIGGFVALVLRLPQHHDDDGDDGAVV